VSKYTFAKLLIVLSALSLLVAGQASAHDITIGASRWCFGTNYIVGNIDLNAALLTAIKGVKEGKYSLDAMTDKELRQLEADVVQPYLDKRLSVSVNDKAYPVKATKIVRGDSGLFTIWLTVDDIGFDKPVNAVKIDYRLLFDETNNSHINLAYLYLSDAAPDAVQKIFDFSQPAAQINFDSTTHMCQVSVKGAAPPAAKQPATGSPFAGSAPGVTGTAKKSAAVTAQADRVSDRARDSVRNAPAEDRKLPEAKGASPLPPAPARSLGSTTGLVSGNAQKKSVWVGIGEFIVLGIEHILTGYDHIAFLLALIVIGLSIREVLKIITAFTVAHSITLLLAAMQIVRLNSRLVESVIALSICYVALENLFRKKIEYRWVVTFCFGLIHGFGFASALQELIVGKSNLLVSVLSFNLGVETGQLMIFFVLLPILHLLRKKMEFRMVTVGASAAVFAIGFAWLVERVFDLKVLPI